MDVAFFLTRRVQFIRQLYLNSIAAFEERKQKIDSGEEPFVPAYSEDGEPPFMEEWQEAEDSLQVIGCACLSMLSSALKLYFTTVEQTYGFRANEQFKSDFKKKGFIGGYGAFFKEELGIDFNTAPGDLVLLEEIVLIRNAFEHPAEIIFHDIVHPAPERKSPSMFFCRENELKAWEEVKDNEGAWLMGSPRVYVDKERLFMALDTVEQFCEWFEQQLTKWRYPGA